MKKYIAFTIILFLTFGLTGCIKKEKQLNDLQIIKKRGYLIAGVKEDSPPFGFYKDKRLTGIDVEIAKTIADTIFNTTTPDNIKYVKVTAQNRISKLNSKEVDILVATMSINEKRKLIIDFSKPYFVTSQKLMVRKKSKITNLQHFNNSGCLAVVMGTTGEKIIHLVAPNARVIGVKNYREALDLLRKSKVDALLGDDCILSGLNNNEFKIINRAYTREFYGVALRKSSESKELLKEVDTAISAVLDDKRMNILKKRFVK